MKKNLLRIVLILLIIAIPATNGVSLILLSEQNENTSEYEPAFLDISSKKVSEVEKYITGLLEKRAKEEEEKRLQLEREEKFRLFLEGIKNGDLTYRKVLSDMLIVGDSLMEGLNTYRVLNSSNMISMVSASLYHLEGNVGKIIANNPKILVTHYGINNLVDTEGYLNSFILQYERIIVKLKNSLPDTKIYISGIFNVSPSVARRYSAIEKYNSRLREMCEKLEVTYLDNSSCLPGDGKFYGSDGIHVSKGFYTDVWLPHLYYEVYLR